MVCSPWTFVDILAQLLNRGHLGPELRNETRAVRESPADAEACTRYLCPDAAVLALTPAADVLGPAQSRSDRLYHPYRIWDRFNES